MLVQFVWPTVQEFIVKEKYSRKYCEVRTSAHQRSDWLLKSVVSFVHEVIHLEKPPITHKGQQLNQIHNNIYSNKKPKRTKQYREE